DAAAATWSEALTVFDNLGTTLWGSRARSLLDQSRTGARTTALLTASELQVAELVASGMTNRDVAAALFISPKTVEVNLTRVYRKLSIRSRAELGRRIDELKRNRTG
ncbi:MAG: helix-turn-helix transcriptional regulator, partial [Mycobacteriaceae bacterium]|nr:helix-turn-helix transcriptional regulator [Mycobacteriaceae bacterium]